MKERGNRRQARRRAIIDDTRASEEVWLASHRADELFEPFALPNRSEIPQAMNGQTATRTSTQDEIIFLGCLRVRRTSVRMADLEKAYIEARWLEEQDYQRCRRGRAYYIRIRNSAIESVLPAIPD